jgi:hypothetical protein
MLLLLLCPFIYRKVDIIPYIYIQEETYSACLRCDVKLKGHLSLMVHSEIKTMNENRWIVKSMTILIINVFCCFFWPQVNVVQCV